MKEMISTVNCLYQLTSKIFSSSQALCCRLRNIRFSSSSGALMYGSLKACMILLKNANRLKTIMITKQTVLNCVYLTWLFKSRFLSYLDKAMSFAGLESSLVWREIFGRCM